MITYSTNYGETAQKGQRFNFSFSGKSTDEKPTHEYDGIAIGNGSTFLEMDTKNVFFYDEETEGWLG